MPPCFAKWPPDFFSNWLARLKVYGDQGRRAPIRQGLPQGSVLSLGLFLLIIMIVVMLADDVFLFCSHVCKLTDQAVMHGAVTLVGEWSWNHKMTLNTNRRWVAFFASNMYETRWQPSINLKNSPLHLTSPGG